MKVKKDMNREVLVNVARTSLRTKVYSELADMLAEVSTCPVVNNVLVTQLLNIPLVCQSVTTDFTIGQVKLLLVVAVGQFSCLQTGFVIIT